MTKFCAGAPQLVPSMPPGTLPTCPSKRRARHSTPPARSQHDPARPQHASARPSIHWVSSGMLQHAPASLNHAPARHHAFVQDMASEGGMKDVKGPGRARLPCPFRGLRFFVSSPSLGCVALSLRWALGWAFPPLLGLGGGAGKGGGRGRSIGIPSFRVSAGPPACLAGGARLPCPFPGAGLGYSPP